MMTTFINDDDTPHVYNRLVTGMTQERIEQLLRYKRLLYEQYYNFQHQEQQHKQQKEETQKQQSISIPSKPPTLQGRVAMTLGLELRRAYVNDLCALPNGTMGMEKNMW